jgi:glutaredoxin
MEIILYSKPQCHLCHEAKELLETLCASVGLTYQEIDIYTDDALLEKYQWMIPVITVDGMVIDWGKVSYHKLKAALHP